MKSKRVVVHGVLFSSYMGFDVLLSEAVVTKGFFALFFLIDIPLASVLMSLFSFPSSFLQMPMQLFWVVWDLRF